MFNDYKQNQYDTLSAAVSGALASQASDLLDYAEYVNVKRAYETENGVLVPPNTLTSEEIANSVDSDNAVFVFHNQLTGENVRSSTVADLTVLLDRAKTNFKNHNSTKRVSNGGLFLTFTTENDSDAFVEAKESITTAINNALAETNVQWADLVGRVASGDITNQDSEYVLLKSYREGMQNLTSHPNWPDLSASDIPSLKTYVSGLYMHTHGSDNYSEFSLIQPEAAAVDQGLYPNTSVVYDVEPTTGSGASAKSFMGYFKADSDADFTFNITGYDDMVGIWVGDQYINTVDNATAIRSNPVNGGYNKPSGTVSMLKGQYYPVLIRYSNAGGASTQHFTITTDTGRTISGNFSDYWYRG